MRELLETLRNTDTHMSISPNELGIKVGFIRINAGDPKKYEFIISDIDLAALEISMEEYILNRLEWFLKFLGIKTHA